MGFVENVNLLAQGFTQEFIDAINNVNGVTQMTVSTTALPEGSTPTASWDGVNYVLSLGIPNGATGATGAQGDTGISISSIVKTNTVGNVDTYTITFSDSSSTTFDVTNGINGTNGIDGTNGLDGANGLSAYEVAVANGFVGTEAQWLASLKGADGTNGTNGVDGYTPIKGVDYFDGINGADGINGVDGTSITSVTSNKVGKDTTVTVNGTFTGAPYQFVVSDGLDGTGAGDMLASVYDTNADGKVNAADSADSVHWSGVTSKPTTFPPSTHTHVVSDVTDFPVFANVATSGSYTDLSNKPTIVAINDLVPSTTEVYSSQRTQDLHNSQQEAIATISGASARFYSNTSQLVPESPASFADLTWTTGSSSTNSSIFELGTNEINFYKDGNYSFLNTLTFYRLSYGSTMTVTFELYDADTSTVLNTATQPIDIAAGTKETLPFNTVLSITGATALNPVRMKVRMQATSANGTLELFSFNSILVAQAIVDIVNVETDPVFTAWDKSTGISITKSQVSDFPTNVSSFTNDSGYVTSSYHDSTKSDITHTHTGVYEPANANIQSHISSTSNPHSTTASQVGALATTGSVTQSGELIVTEFTETVYALSGTDINPANGTIQTKTLSGTTTLTESLVSGQSVLLQITIGSNTLNFPTITWLGGTPTITHTGISVFVVWKVGSTLYGKYAGEL